MTTQAELEAAIERAPDDRACYAVYGDWLEAQGDPRGQLVALQLASSDAPGDKTRARRARQYLAAHEEHFLGKAARLDTIILEWYGGFIRTIRFRNDANRIGALLRDLVRHPSGRFVQSIALARAEVTPATIVAVLRSERRPTTLAELRIGDAWSVERDGAALRAIFPRLGQGLAPDWRRLVASIRDERRTALSYDVAALSPLVPLAGVDLAGATTEDLVRGLRFELEGIRELGLVVAMRRSFEPASLEQLAIELASQYVAGKPQEHRWGFDALGHFGGESAARWIAAQLSRWSHATARWAIELLADIGKRTESGNRILFLIAEDETVALELRDRAEVKLANATGITGR